MGMPNQVTTLRGSTAPAGRWLGGSEAAAKPPRGSVSAAGGPQPAASTPATRNLAKVRRGAKIPRRELLSFTTQLAILARSGMDLASSLQSLAHQCRHHPLRAILRDVYEQVTRGQRVSEALRCHVATFGESYIASIAAGEASGKLSEVLRQLASLQRSEVKLRGTLRTMLAYPILLASVSGLVLCGLIVFVLPQFAEIFEQYEMPLPALTRVLLGISLEIRHRSVLWAIVVALAGGGLTALLRSRQGQQLRDHWVLNARLLRDVSRNLLMGRACRLLGIMISNGVPLLDCLRLASSSIPNSSYRNLFARLEEEVLNGRNLGPTLLAASFIPPTAAEMIATAEQTGTLGEVTTLLGEHFLEEGEMRMRDLVAILEPLITVGMGLVVGVVVLAVMLPMFDIATFAQKSP